MKTAERIGAALLSLALASCAAPLAKAPSAAHLGADDQPATPGAVPPPLRQTLTLPPPRPTPRAETYSVVVNNVQVHDLLFALARDARINVDVHPGITGTVTLNAIDQTLPQLLTRISKQVDMRWEMDGPNLTVMPDSPYLYNYKVDYVNMSRDTSGSIAVTTQIATSVPGTTGGSTSGGNNSATRIENTAKNRFWETLVQNVKDILRETDKIMPEGSSETVVEQASSQSGVASAPTTSGPRGSTGGETASSQQANGTTMVRRVTFREAASVIANPETGILSVRASARQHERVREFIDQVMASAKRQVLIEATIVEVELSQSYEQGIDWGRLRVDATRTGITGRTISPFTGGAQLVLGRAADGTADGAIRLLETFGNVKVLSSPKLSVLNNQSAVLKVVDNLVYFTVKAETTSVGSGNATVPLATFTTTPYTVPVGFVMNVTPQVSADDTVLLNLRPSISRVVRDVQDPNPALRRSTSTGLNEDIVNLVPVIRTREMESMMRVENGNIAVLGGLMEDARTGEDQAVPFFNRVPLLGALFTQRDDAVRKTELVIFLRPTVIRDASINGDFSDLRGLLPAGDFLNQGFVPPKYQVAPSTPGALQ